MNPLRNPNINYRKGWFFITFQVAHNKTVFGVVADKKLTLNALGRMVDENLRKLGVIFPELEIDTAIVMPNHVHVVVRTDSAERDLSWFVGRFKSFTANQYHKMAKSGECVDIGSSLWQRSYYDNLVSSHNELENIRRYILRNPERWEDDRFGPVTTYTLGNAELLNGNLAAFVASDTRDNWRAEKPHVRSVREWLGREPVGRDVPIVSTFTSFEEQGALVRRLAEKLPFIWVDPAGIKANLPVAVRAACEEGWGLVMSPVPSGTGVNKQRAIWCNRWVLKVAARIYVGSIKKGGTLDTLLSPARRPGTHDMGRPGTHDMGRPGTHDMGRPGKHDVRRPGTHDMGRPGTHDMGRPGKHDVRRPGTHDMGRLGKHDVRRPGTHDKERSEGLIMEDNIVGVGLRAHHKAVFFKNLIDKKEK